MVKPGGYFMMSNEFQMAVLQELKSINKRINSLDKRINSLDKRIDDMDKKYTDRFNQLEARQDEIYNIVKAIEHSNQVARSELDRHNIKISKLEGKFRKVAEAFNEDDEAHKVSNL